MTEISDWRILIIDDEDDICNVLSLTLAETGFRVSTAADSDVGLEMCRSFEPHIVITDIRMPGKDGIALLEKIKARHPNVEVIVSTAYGEMELVVKALQLDASDFITKPINHHELMMALEKAKQRVEAHQKRQEHTQYLEQGWSQTTQELIASSDYQQRLIESSMDGILGCDADEKVVSFNQSMEQMFGYNRRLVLGRMTLTQFFEPDQEHHFRESLASEAYGGPNRLFLYETRMRAKDGALIPVQISANLMFKADQPKELVCFIRDMRQIHILEQQMADQARTLHQQKMISLGRLAASMAEEINHPLSSVLNYIRLMVRILSPKKLNPEHLAKFQRYLDVVDQEIHHCSRIVTNLLTFARKSPVVHQPVALDEALERCIVLSRHHLELGNIELCNHTNNHLPQVKGDTNQLQQCLINLIFNAIEAMPLGGYLELGATCSDNGQKVIISVKDSGHGIAADALPHIFEPFFTTKKEDRHTGLGLATAYGIISSHKGSIEVDSEPGQRTIFTITLPAIA